MQFIELIKQRNPDFTSDSLTAIISGEADSILQILNGKIQKNQISGVDSGEADLLEAIQLVIQKYRSKSVPSPTLPQTTPSQPQPIPQQPHAVSIPPGENGLFRTIQQIGQQTSIPIFSGEADLVQFIELIKQRNPEFTSSQLNAILSSKASTIAQILNEKAQRNQYTGIAVQSGEADLLEAIQIVLQQYRNPNAPNPAFPQTIPPQPLSTPLQAPPVPVQSGQGDLLQTVQRIQQQTSIPIFSGEADLVQFIELIRQRNPELTSSQLNQIISGEANSILQILNEKSQRNQSASVAVQSGEADLLEAIEIVIQKYRGRNGAVQTFPQTAPVQAQPIPQPQTVPIQSGESNLLQTIRNIEQQSLVPIFSGEADLVQFIEIIRQNNPELTQNQISSIISGEANSILQILNEKRQSGGSSLGTAVNSGEANLLDAIFQILRKYRRNYQSTPSFLPTQYGPPAQPQVKVSFMKAINMIDIKLHGFEPNFESYTVFSDRSSTSTDPEAEQFTNVGAWSSDCS